MSANKKIFGCTCTEPDHAVMAIFDVEDEDSYFALYVQMRQYNDIFRRLKIAIKYVLGRSDTTSHWDCTLLGLNEAYELRGMLEQFINKKEVEQLTR